MQYTNEPLKLNDPSLGTRIFGLVLLLLSLAIFGWLVYMTFIYVPEPNETPLEGWNLYLGWGFGMLLSLGMAFFGWGAWVMGGKGGYFASKDPGLRVQAIGGGNVPKDILIRMAMTDPEAQVRLAAIKAIPMDDLEEAYENCKNSTEYNCPELIEHVSKHRQKAFFETASTLDGFKTLNDDQKARAVDELPRDVLKEFFPNLDNVLDQLMILGRVHTDKKFVQAVATDERYDTEVRVKALKFMAEPKEFAILLKQPEVDIRTVAVERMAPEKECHKDLVRHLLKEENTALCEKIVAAVGAKLCMIILKNKPSNASTEVVINACDDAAALKKIVETPGLSAQVGYKIEERVKQLEAHEAQKNAAQSKKSEIANATDEGVLFATIEDLREKRDLRVEATLKLAKLRPKNKINIHAGPQLAWHCPLCSDAGDVCMKPTNWETMTQQAERGAIISGTVACPKCGTSHGMADVLSGKMDVIMVNISCPHCDNPMAGPIDSWINCECMNCGETVIAK